MKKSIFSIFYLCMFSTVVSCQEIKNVSVEKAILNEFELLNLCHCHEYLTRRHYDYVAWKSEEWKQKRIEEEKHLVFGQYSTARQFGLYYQNRFDSTRFYKEGISLMLDKQTLDFGRLDSLYFEPLVQHYVSELSKNNPVPYFGLNHNNFYWDCFNKVKEIPLKSELEYFIKSNTKQ